MPTRIYIPDRNEIGLVTAQPDNPAPGADLQWPSPEMTRILIHSIYFTLVTDANAANRRACVEAYHGGTPFCMAPSPGHQVASETIAYRFAPCILGIDESDDLAYMWAPMSGNLILEHVHALYITVLNIQATDQISAVKIRFYQKLPR